MTKTVKAWAVVNERTGLRRMAIVPLSICMTKRDAMAYAFYPLDNIIACTITYEIPKRKKK